MELSRRDFVATMAASGLIGIQTTAAAGVAHYVRYEYRGKRAYGLLEQDAIREIRGGAFWGRKPNGGESEIGGGEIAPSMRADDRAGRRVKLQEPSRESPGANEA